MQDVYLGLGSNLEDPIAQVKKALSALQHLPHTTFISVSSLYQSSPLTKPLTKPLTTPESSPQAQSDPDPDYINAVVKLATELLPHELLDECQALEQRQGRVRGPEPWAPRTLDVDILCYGEQIIEDDRLTIPHPGLVERNFVLYPLYEIAPDLELPQLGSVATLLGRCERGDLQLLQSI